MLRPGLAAASESGEARPRWMVPRGVRARHGPAGAARAPCGALAAGHRSRQRPARRPDGRSARRYAGGGGGGAALGYCIGFKNPFRASVYVDCRALVIIPAITLCARGSRMNPWAVRAPPIRCVCPAASRLMPHRLPPVRAPGQSLGTLRAPRAGPRRSPRPAPRDRASSRCPPARCPCHRRSRFSLSRLDNSS